MIVVKMVKSVGFKLNTERKTAKRICWWFGYCLSVCFVVGVEAGSEWVREREREDSRLTPRVLIWTTERIVCINWDNTHYERGNLGCNTCEVSIR